MTDTFSDPSQSGDVLKPVDILGHLLIVRPLSYETAVPTVHGDKDAIRCDVADVTANEIHRDVLWFGGYLVGGLKNSIGQTVLAEMAQGTAKPGQSPPWILEGKSADPTAVASATQFLAVNGATWNGLSNPAPAPAAVAAQAPVI